MSARDQPRKRSPCSAKHLSLCLIRFCDHSLFLPFSLFLFHAPLSHPTASLWLILSLLPTFSFFLSLSVYHSRTTSIYFLFLSQALSITSPFFSPYCDSLVDAPSLYLSLPPPLSLSVSPHLVWWCRDVHNNRTLKLFGFPLVCLTAASTHI